jgi:AI-2 transport protein TqsA
LKARQAGATMIHDRAIRTLLGICTAILIISALYYTRAILAPVAFSLFIIAIAWPFQSWLQTRIPKLLALAITVLAILIAVSLLASLMIWGFSRIAQWLVNNAARFQMLYAHTTDWLEGYGISVASQLADNFNVGWAIRTVQGIGGRIHGLISFIVITFVFTALGLLEVDIVRRNIESLRSKEIGQSLLRAGVDIAAKFQKYMLVRSIMSVLTGAMIWAVALFAGLELATAWGVIAFVLNYIPFIGPLVATVFPTLFAAVQFESWQLALVIFVSLNLIQFLIGSYLEPRITGATLSISPFVILFAVFFWSFLWGIPGAFIGVPIVIACLAICDQYESSRWVPTLLSGRETPPPSR